MKFIYVMIRQTDHELTPLLVCVHVCTASSVVLVVRYNTLIHHRQP